MFTDGASLSRRILRHSNWSKKYNPCRRGW